MKKAIFTAFAAAVTTFSAAGQTVFSIQLDGSGAGSSVSPMTVGGGPVEQKTIGPTTIEATYDYRYATDTLNRTRTKEDVMILQAGGPVSKFYSYRTCRVDSMLMAAVSAESVMANLDNYRGGENWTIYKNYPSGRTTITDKIGMDHYRVEEEFAPQAWQVMDEVRTIEGYTCRRAECDFRGRHWIAWFTPEIPIAEGPWKLSGLGGLILEAADSRGDHTFVISGLRAVEGVVTWPEHQYIKASRRDHLRAARRFIENPLAMMASAGTVVKVMGADGKEFTPTTNAMKYDFLEADVR